MQYLNSNNPYPRTLNLEETLKIIIEQNYFFFLIIQASHDSPRKEINLIIERITIENDLKIVNQM